MKTVGIIAEYNPFHNGHLYQMQEARRKSKADFLIVVMSPDFVQRGEPALLDKWARARMALDAGADLVLELPVRYATGSAEFFASSAVSVLAGLGVVDSLSFGCEMDRTTDESALARELFEYARFLSQDEPKEYSAILREHLRNGETYAHSRFLAYLSCTGTEDNNGLLKSPNNILAVEYMKAILRSGSSMNVLPIARIGAGYHDQTIPDTTDAGSKERQPFSMFASATGIRSAFIQGENIQDLMPPTALKILQDEVRLHRFLVPADLDLPLHLALYDRRSSLTDYVDVSEDLANRIDNLLPQYTGFDQFTALLKTRQIAYTRVRRALIHILLGLKKNSSNASYARVLGFRKGATVLLHEIKKKASIPLITKLTSDLKAEPGEDRLSSGLKAEPGTTKPSSGLEEYPGEAKLTSGLKEEPEAARLSSSLKEDLEATRLWELVASHKTGAPARNERQRQILIGEDEPD